jgi:hypothetical protein
MISLQERHLGLGVDWNSDRRGARHTIRVSGIVERRVEAPRGDGREKLAKAEAIVGTFRFHEREALERVQRTRRIPKDPNLRPRWVPKDPVGFKEARPRFLSPKRRTSGEA